MTRFDAGIDHRRVVALAIENEDVATRAVEKHRIRILAGRNVGERFERCEIEGDHPIVTATAHVTPMKPRHERNAVRAFQSREIANDFSAVHVGDHQMIASRDEHASRGGVDDEKIPAAQASEYVPRCFLPLRRCGAVRRRCGDEHHDIEEEK